MWSSANSRNHLPPPPLPSPQPLPVLVAVVGAVPGDGAQLLAVAAQRLG